MSDPLSTALYIKRKRNRYRNMPNFIKAETISAVSVEITFNQDITATNYVNGWYLVVDKKDQLLAGLGPTASNKIAIVTANPIIKGQSIWFSYKQSEGDYLGQRGEIMQSFTGFASNLV